MNTEQTANASRTRQRPKQHPETEARPPEREAVHEEGAGRTRTRKRNMPGGATRPSHDTYLNMQNIPKTTSVEWKLFTATGLEYPFYLQAMRSQGWEPVNPQEHPDWVNLPADYPHKTVIVDGLILMERPKELTEEARQENYFNAGNQIREAEQRLGKNPRAVDYNPQNFQGDAHLQKLDKQMMRPIAVEE